MRILARLLAVVTAITATLSAPVRRLLSRLDPFETRELYLSPVRRWYHARGFQLCAGLAMVALAALPGLAMPAFGNSGAIQFWTTAPIGLAGPMLIGATEQPKLLPFRFGTVKRRINIGTFAMTPGTQLPAVLIPQVGMMSRVLYNVQGSYTVANAPLVIANTDGFDSLIAKAQIMLNNGSANIVDLSGIGIRTINKNLNTALPIKRSSPAGVGNVNATQMPLAIGASTFQYKGFLPVNANQRRQFEMGLINLQAPELRATIALSFNPLAQLFTVPANATLFAATINLSYEYYEIPDLSKYAMPPLTLVRTIEEAPAAIAATGLQLYQIPRLGTMIEYHAVLILNNLYGSANTSISQYQVRYNKSDTQYDVFMGDWETYEAELYGVGIDVGQAPTPTAATPQSRTLMDSNALSFNLWSAGDTNINGGDFRDAIDTEENTTTESLVFITAGTALNPGKDNLVHVRRVVQRIIPAQGPRA